LDYKKDEAESEYLSESMFGSFESKFPQKDLRSLGLYVQDFITYGSFSATLGYRYDQNEKFGSISTYRIAPVYFINKTETKLRATYGTGFKAPSLYNLFAPIYGNQDLKPEKSIGWDIGIDQYLFTSQLSIGITYFKMKFDDMIGFNDNFQSININRAETNGIETMLELKDFHGISITANFTFNETYDLSDPSSDGLQLIRRPKNQFSLFMNYQLENLNLGTSIRYSGKKFDEDFSTFPSKRVSLDPYTLLNFYASYNINESLLIFGRIENITDEDYQDILFYGNLGRSGYLGFEFKF
jgi:vitamin B12 transporter